MMTEQGLVYIYKIQTSQTLLATYELYNIPTRPKHTDVHIYPKYAPKTKLLKNSLFYKFLDIYTNLPDHLKISIIGKFKNQIKTYIKLNFHPYSFPNNLNESDSDSQ